MKRDEAPTEAARTSAREDVQRTEREVAPHESASRMDLVTHLAALGVGATAMFFLDPSRGRHRRHLMRDQLLHAAREGADALGAVRRDLANRSGGVAAAAMRGTRSGGIDGDIADQPERHAIVDDVAAPPDARTPARSRSEPPQETWTPAARLLAGMAGGALTAMALRADDRHAPGRTLLGIAGAALVVRSATNVPLGHLIGAPPDEREITMRRSITIAASIDDVFNWLIAWESWPRWMSHVRRVRTIRGAQSARECTHWVVEGPAGTTVEWDAETTELTPPHVIRWRTIDASPVAHAGIIRLFQASDHTTRLELQVTYVQAGGAYGQGLAILFRRRPRRQIDDDLARLKAMIEAVRTPDDVAAPMAKPEGRADDARRQASAPDSRA